MNKFLKLFFIFVIPFSLYHLLRDILQDYHVVNFATNFLKMNKNWCSPYCDFITIPFEVFLIVSAIIIVKRNKTGLVGYLAITIFIIWTMMFLYDYFIYN
jgi:hypothetical protein